MLHSSNRFNPSSHNDLLASVSNVDGTLSLSTKLTQKFLEINKELVDTTNNSETNFLQTAGDANCAASSSAKSAVSDGHSVCEKVQPAKKDSPHLPKSVGPAAKARDKKRKSQVFL